MRARQRAPRSAAQRAANAVGVGARRPAGGGRSRRAPPGRRGAAHLDAEAEAVEQLRAQLALLGVHRARRAGSARRARRETPRARRATTPERGGVEQHVDEVVGQQVDLVDVEDPPVGARRAARARRPARRPSARAEVERAHEPVQASRRAAARPARPGAARRRASAGTAPSGAQLARARTRTARPSAAVTGGSSGASAAHRGRLRRAALAAHEHAADRRARPR